MEKSDILVIRKGGNIVSMTPYTQTKTRRARQEWLEWRLTPLFIFIFTTFLRYIIHLPWCENMEINLAAYDLKEINIAYIWDSWLRLYPWISSHDHPEDIVDWDSKGHHQWPQMVLLQHFFYPVKHWGCHYTWWICFCVFLEGWESWGVLVMHPEWLDASGGWW